MADIDEELSDEDLDLEVEVLSRPCDKEMLWYRSGLREGNRSMVPNLVSGTSRTF